MARAVDKADAMLILFRDFGAI